MSSRFVLAALFALAACAQPIEPAELWVDAAATGEQSVAIHNRGSDPVYVRVIDPTELWQSIGCGPSNCLRVNPRQTVRVPYAEIINYTPGDAEAAVTWWLYADDSGSRLLDSGSVYVEL
jgi:hypothetical protein